MWWIHSICNIVSWLVIMSSFLCYGRVIANQERMRIGFKPRFKPKKLSLWININLIIAIITLVITIINFLIYILFN